MAWTWLLRGKLARSPLGFLLSEAELIPIDREPLVADAITESGCEEATFRVFKVNFYCNYFCG